MAFAELGLSPELVKAVTDAGYTTPTPIQAQAIPSVLSGRDVLGCAQTGTGKTASFTLPMMDVLSNGRARARMPRSLILEPTRELAAQVAENFDKYGKYSKLSMALLIGGVSYADQEKLLDRGVDVLIATPGRLLDHFERGRILLTDVKILVIDEADRMLDMGFIPDIERIVGMLPKRRQTLFFSATMAPDIRRLADAFLSDPKEITVAPPASTGTLVAQHLTVVDEMDKRETLRRLIRSEEVRNAIIFCNRKRDIAVLHKSLQKHGFNVAALHGDMVQSARMETLDRFKKGEVTLLIASDVAARGLDIADLSHVFNFDVPIHSEDYVHRIGRTGRAGKTGRAFMLATPDEGRAVAAVESLIGKEIPRLDVDGIQTVEFASEEEGGRRGRGRGRGAAAKKPARKAAEPRKAEPKVAAVAVADDVEAPVPAAADSAKPARTPRSRGRKSTTVDLSADSVEPVEVAASSASAPARPERNRTRDSNRDGGSREDRRDDRRADRHGERRPGTGNQWREDGDVPVKGLGDHVPAFLLRPVKLAKSA